MPKVTAEEVKAAILASGVTYFVFRECSLCAYPLSYQIVDGEPFYDMGCNCTRLRYPLERRSWNDIAYCINIQTKPEVIAELRATFKLPPPEAANGAI